MFKIVLSLIWWFRAFLRSRNSLGLEILALRQQLSVLKRKNPRPRLSVWDQVFWVVLRRVWSRWSEVLVVVKPKTVVRWHGAGFRLYWRWLSQRREKGRPKIDYTLRQLIERMAKENPLWGAPRIHGELLKLGLEISERTVSRYLARMGRKGDTRKLWLIFLKNHREVMAAMDFFTVPTASFRVLYCFFVISHRRRKVLHFNTTEHPTSGWIVQQLREAFPDDTAPRYLILDRDRKYEGEATEVLRSMSRELIRTAYQSPWQNGVAERWVGSCRRELLDHVIVVNEGHLRRLVREYLGYYHGDRIHDGLGKDTPYGRPVEGREGRDCRVAAIPRVGVGCTIGTHGVPPHERLSWQEHSLFDLLPNSFSVHSSCSRVVRYRARRLVGPYPDSSVIAAGQNRPLRTAPLNIEDWNLILIRRGFGDTHVRSLREKEHIGSREPNSLHHDGS